MSWHISTRNIKRIRSYEEAVAAWDAAKTWKDHDPTWRPLAGLQELNKRIVKLSDGGYACTMYWTDMVTYYPTRVVLAHHRSLSSLMFFSCVKPDWATYITSEGQRFWEVDGQFYKSDRPLEFQFIDGKWSLSTETKEVMEWVYQPKKAAELRKLLKPYSDWYPVASRLIGPFAAYGYKGSVQAYLLNNDPSDTSAFTHMATKIGSPDQIREILMRTDGGYIKVPAPLDRLPRNIV